MTYLSRSTPHPRPTSKAIMMAKMRFLSVDLVKVSPLKTPMNQASHTTKPDTVGKKKKLLTLIVRGGTSKDLFGEKDMTVPTLILATS
jgi:hypothetical protein